MASKRALVLKVFHGEAAERVPVGFWHHYLESPDEFDGAVQNPELIEKNLAGARKYKEAFDPDFVKIMTDGLFNIPYDYSGIHGASDLSKLKPLPDDDPWFDANVRLVRSYREIYGDDILLFFNEFAPLTQLRSHLDPNRLLGAKDIAVKLLEEDPEAVTKALDVIADDLIRLTTRVVGSGLADGIYLSVANPNRQIPEVLYRQYVTPSEQKILKAAKALAADHILHICGYEGNRNILSVYADYDVSVVNWAVHAEQFDLARGKALFAGKALIGGFDNTRNSLLYRGSEQEIKAYAKSLLEKVGREGVVIGADCTVPADIDVQRLLWVREAVNE